MAHIGTESFQLPELAGERLLVGRIREREGGALPGHLVLTAMEGDHLVLEGPPVPLERTELPVSSDRFAVMSGERVRLIAVEGGATVYALGLVWGYRLTFFDTSGQPCLALRCRRLLESRATVWSSTGAILGEVVSRQRRTGYVLRNGDHEELAHISGPHLAAGSLEVIREGAVLAQVSRAQENVSLATGSASSQQRFTAIQFMPSATTLERVLTLASAFLVSFDHGDPRWR